MVVDSYYYGKLVVAPLNIVLYNVFTPHGPDLYGECGVRSQGATPRFSGRAFCDCPEAKAAWQLPRLQLLLLDTGCLCRAGSALPASFHCPEAARRCLTVCAQVRVCLSAWICSWLLFLTVRLHNFVKVRNLHNPDLFLSVSCTSGAEINF